MTENRGYHGKVFVTLRTVPTGFTGNEDLGDSVADRQSRARV